MKHKHKWKEVGIANSGFGYSTSLPVLWCVYCGAINKFNKTRMPKKSYRKNNEKD